MDLDAEGGGRLFVVFPVESDGGAEVTKRTKDGELVWRTFVSPLMIPHSAYRQDVEAWIDDNAVHVRIDGAKTINEILNLKTGESISRTITERDR